MHAASSPHDPRFRNSRAAVPNFRLREIRTIAALMPPPTDMVYFSHMPAKNHTKKHKATLDSVLSTIERGFAAVSDDITDIKSKMATKDDIADVRRGMATKDDITRLDTKLTKFEDREIDKRLQLEVRVSAIERHLGLDKKIAA
jgi:hypothetical protein